jgi:hypothetical protein
MANVLAAHNAFQQIILHPDHQDALVEVPPDQPLCRVNAPGMPWSSRYNEVPEPKSPVRRQGMKSKRPANR